jgi:hypothetical protein
MVKRKFNFKKYILALMTVGLGGVVASYLMAANSAAFLAASTYLINSQKVIETLGPIKSHRLGFDYSLNYRSGDGSAKFKVALIGERKSADAYVTLETTDGVWRVTSGNLIEDGQNPVPLLPESR